MTKKGYRLAKTIGIKRVEVKKGEKKRKEIKAKMRREIKARKGGKK